MGHGIDGIFLYDWFFMIYFVLFDSNFCLPENSQEKNRHIIVEMGPHACDRRQSHDRRAIRCTHPAFHGTTSPPAVGGLNDAFFLVNSIYGLCTIQLVDIYGVRT